MGVIDQEGYTTPHPGATAPVATDADKGLFQEIYGHEDIKTVINMAIRSEKSVHVLLTSPPGMAKTQFLLAIRNTLENESCFVVGSKFDQEGNNRFIV